MVIDRTARRFLYAGGAIVVAVAIAGYLIESRGVPVVPRSANIAEPAAGTTNPSQSGAPGHATVDPQAEAIYPIDDNGNEVLPSENPVADGFENATGHP